MKKAKAERGAAKEEAAARGTGIKRFAITYLILMSVFFFLIGFTPFQRVVDINGVYTRGVVVTTARLLGIMGIQCTHEGSIIHLPSIALDVKFGCNGLEAVMIYSVAVLAFPASWKKKLIGMTTGFVVIQVVNIMRIAGLGYSGVHFPGMFEYIHIYVAQGMMIAVSLGVFFLYLNYARE
ncbi:MAG: exosortase H [Thermodesulfovibrionales bacterium]